MEPTTMMEQIISSINQEVIGWRRYLHQHPELSFHEQNTAQFVYETLESFGHLILSRPTRTSVMARLIGMKPGPVIALRADMDALPIQEENTFDFTSQNPGVMHACGHDGHTAMLLGTAKALTQLKEHLHGEVRFLFQHAEETWPGGAQEMVDAGVLEGVDAVFGTHLWSPLDVGKIGIVYGPMMASMDKFTLTIQGQGGHAALPHQTIDSIAVGSQVVTNLQHIVSRNTDPLDQVVVSVTQFTAGTTFNVIPDTVLIRGTVRTLDQKVRTSLPVLMERVIKGITDAHGATYNFDYVFGYHPVINNHQTTAFIEDIVLDAFGETTIDRMKPNMGGEDFSAFQQHVPGTFFYVGAGNKQKGIIHPHHHPKFTIDEDALTTGVNLFVRIALSFAEKAQTMGLAETKPQSSLS
ncbi:M20 family metallopeptidase [Aneurinibacillus sp. REN35]|uniref:M20 family metallopeptidase n=1 Tax=Aneurinibacillus sp. REN35 TaxID=3237286 RepID=UPI003527936B